ncbi:hypothetical protein PAPHI01_2231 [Pancytospora philotis]|nr:hypothetical protein PAPHI01_2231 [Pancytospora philotis]
MAAYSCGTLTCALWALVGLTSALSDIYKQLKNGETYGYSGSLEIDSKTTVYAKSDGVFEVEKALIKLSTTGSDADHHEVSGLQLYESETEGPADWDLVDISLRARRSFHGGSLEFYTDAPIVLKTGYWYSIKFHSPRVREGYSFEVFIKPWQCPDLKPYAKAKPADHTPDFSYTTIGNYYITLYGIMFSFVGLALWCFVIYYCCCLTKRRAGPADGQDPRYLNSNK